MKRVILLRFGTLQINLLKLIGAILMLAAIFQLVLVIYSISELPYHISSVNSCFARATGFEDPGIFRNCQETALSLLKVRVNEFEGRISFSKSFEPLFRELSMFLIWLMWFFIGLILYRLHAVIPVEELEFRRK